MNPALLLLADSRLPTGGHAHSAGVEAAAARGGVRTPDDVERFLAARVPTTGLVTAAASAAACALVGGVAGVDGVVGAAGDGSCASCAAGVHHALEHCGVALDWAPWDDAVSARTPVAALREVSRAQGRALRRTARATWPSPLLEALPPRPHQPLVLGVATAVAGGDPAEAAALAVHHLAGQVCSAAVRLLGLDPLALAGVHARALAAAAPVVAEAASAGRAAASAGDPALLPAASTPLPEVLAVLHARSEGALFAS